MEYPIFSSYVLPIVLALIMLGMGLSLTMRDFKNIFLQPTALIVGLICQLILLPIIAFLIAHFSGLQAEFQVGIVLIAACPGGAVSNLITYLLSGNVALSVSMTTVNSFLVIFSIPIMVDLALWFFLDGNKETTIELPFWSTIFQILLMTVIPCLVGIYIRYINKIFAYILERPLKFVMPIMLALAMLGAVFLENGEDEMTISLNNYLGLGALVFLLNVLGMLKGYWLAYGLRLGKDNQITIAVEVGLQNTALAITIATSPAFLNNHTMAIPASIYALFTFFSAAIFGLMVKPELLKFRR